jgi:gliding motility-associated-like protein
LHGTATIDGNNVIYIPNPGFTGNDTFIYVICDNGTPVSLCDTAVVVVTVNPDTTPTDSLNAQPDIDYTAINTPVTINVLANDEGENLDVTLIADQPDNGTAIINPDNTVTYTPNDGFVGTDYFEYVVCNTVTGECDMTIVAVIVLPLDSTNVAPNAVNDMGNTNEGETICVEVLSNDNDPFGGDSITITNFTQPASGTVTQEGNQLCYTPNDGFIGEDIFTYTICDNGNPVLCDDAVVVIGVGTTEIPNNAPLAEDDIDTTEMNTPVIIEILVNDTDPDGDGINITLITAPGHGTAVLSGTNVIYTPEDGFVGVDYFTYVICDNGMPNLCDTAYVTIYVEPQGIQAQPDIAFTNVNIPVQINVLANDLGGTDPLTVTAILTQPTNGTVVNNGSSITYTPNTDFVGTDYLQYIVCDALGNCDTTLVTIIVLPDSITNLPPNAVNDVATTPIETEVCIDVLDNDNDPLGGNIINISTFTQPANGATMQLNDSTICYLPNPGFTGLDSFTYVICDNGTPQLCDTAIVVINVGSDQPSNDPPVADDESETTPMNTPIIIDILEGDFDPNGDDITVTFISEPANGTAVIDPITGLVTYTPNDGFTGTDFFTYIICDNGTPTLCDTAYVSINVTEISDPMPPVAVNDTVTTEVNTDIVINVMDNDSDPNGDPISLVSITEQPAHGNAIITTDPVTGAVTVTYMPDPDYIGLDTFCYVIIDPTGLTDTACVFITITEATQNQEVIAVDDADTTDVGIPVTIPVLGNDTYNIDGATELEITIIDNPSNGTATVNPDSTITYTPNAGFIGTDTFTYVLCVTTPDTLLCDTAIVVITVEGEPNCELVFATGFSPNDDNINELYLIAGASASDLEQCYPGMEPELVIFNRWGDVVYRVANYDNSKAWNGKLNGTGQNSPDATYFYILTIDPNDKDANYQGCFELKR